MQKNNIRLFVCDLDGTMFFKPPVLSARSKNAMKKLREKGIKIMISSGRPFESIQRLIPEDLYDYASGMNGQDLFLKEENRHLLKPCLAKTDMETLARYTERFPAIIVLYRNNGCLHITGRHYAMFETIYSHLLAFHHRENKVPASRVSQTDLKDLQNIRKIAFASFPSVLQKLDQALTDETAYSHFFVHSSWLEVMMPGISKGNTLKKVMEMEKLTPQNVVVIGDGENDLPLFACADTRVAMGNAMKALKKEATHVTGTVLENGAAQWIEDYLL